MSVSTIRTTVPRGATFSRSKRARRFWGAMAVALRETGRRSGGEPTEAREAFAGRAISQDVSWRLPSAA